MNSYLARIDIWGFKVTRHISLFLNFLTGKPSASFFDTFNAIFLLSFLSWGVVNLASQRNVFAIFWSVLCMAGATSLWFSARETKKRIEEDILYVVMSISERGISVVLTCWSLFFLPFPPYELPITLRATFLASAWFARTMALYCYLHNLPPREPAHSRAWGWLKNKLQSFVPNPLPSPA